MHPMYCNCPSCRAAAGEFELYGAFEAGELLSENEEFELAMELLSAQNEQELEQFLGGLFKKVGAGLKSVGKFVGKNVLPVVGPALKSLAKAALPIAGGALGSLIPIPGVGTMIGRGLGQAVASALELETAGMSPDQADIEKARRFIRIAATAIADASAALGTSPVVPGSAPAEQIARTVVANATRRHVPGVNATVLRQVASGARTSEPSKALAASGGAAAIAGRAAGGRWWRRGNAVVIEGV
ncbi:hypothetical protein [Sinorhizobium sp. GL28]|uniref:hypothetical protein n=1 Tax=Sinorhizobium sp. GL28 TaxID=1358418 RepID=UPI00071C3D40|nr:hypothetical protein [Sinorhizobium sp. GL28]KSV91006.1 hypothetical protein N184_25155 [Sinorhizobium sp. GL28]